MLNDSRLPDLLVEQFRNLRRRLVGVSVAGGIGLTFFLTGVVLAAALLLDLSFDLPTWLRIALLCGVGLVGLGSCLLTVLLPLWRSFRDEELAAIVESVHPGLNERLLSTIELAQARESGEDVGSPLMVNLLLDQTLDFAGRNRFADAIDARRAVRRCWMGAAVVLALILPFLFATNAYAVLISRLFNPWGNYERIQNLVLTVRDADRVAARNEDVKLEVDAAWRLSEGEFPESVWLEWIPRDGSVQRRRLDWNENSRVYSGTLTRIEQSFDYQVFGGGARTKTHHIEVVDRPAVTSFSYDLTPPAYTGEPAEHQDGALGEIMAIEQSRLEFTATLNTPVETVDLLWLDPPAGIAGIGVKPIESLPDGNSVYEKTSLTLSADKVKTTHRLTAAVQGQSGRFVIRATDRHGLSSHLDQLRRLTVIADEAPHIQFADREQHAEARAIDLVEIPVAALDDFGLATVQLHYEVIRGANLTESAQLDVPQAQLGGKGLNHLFKLDLAPLKLTPGMQLTVRARATDERPVPEPNVTWTETRVIRIRQDAKPYGETTVADQQHRTEQVMENLQFELQKQKNEARRLQEEARVAAGENREFDKQQDLEKLDNSMGALAEQMDKLGALMEQQPLFEHLGEQTRKLGDEQIQKAQQKIQQAERKPSAEKQQPLGEAVNELERASQDLQKLQEEYHKLAMLQRDLLELNRLAANTERLADHVDSLLHQHQEMAAQKDPVTAAQQEKWNHDHQQLANEHQQLQQDLDGLLSRRPDLVDAARENLKSNLARLAQQAEELSRKQDQLADATRRQGERQSQEMQGLRQEQSQLQDQMNRLADALRLPQGDQQQVTGNQANKQAREALQKGNKDAAMQQHREAARQLEELANLLDANNRLPQNPGAAAQQLADRQRQIADEVAAMDPQAAPEQRDQAMSALAARQAAVQAAADQLPRGDVINPQRDTAVNKGREAAHSLAHKNQEAAKAQSQEAAQALQKVADVLKRNSELPGEPGARAQQLAQRQQQLAEALQKFDGNTPQEERTRQLDAFADEQAAIQLAGEQIPRSEAIQPDRDNAVNRARDAANSLRGQNVDGAKTPAAEAAKALQEVADVMKKNSALSGKPAEAARQLAERQRQVAEELAKIPADAPAEEQQQKLAGAADEQAALQLAAENLPTTAGTKPASEQAAARSREATQAVRRNDRNGAVERAKQAAEAFEQLANQMQADPGLAEAPMPAAAPTPSAQAAQQARQLAERQRQAAEQLAARDPEPPQGASQPSLAELMNVQEQLAEQARRLEQETRTGAPMNEAAKQQSQQFAQKARQAAEQMQRLNTKEGSEAAAQAAEAAKQAAEALAGDPTDGAPENLKEFAAIAAEEQQRLAEQLRQLAESGNNSRMARELQQNLERQTESLAEQLAQRSDELTAPALDRAPRAEQATRAAAKAAEADAAMQQSLAQMQRADQGMAADSGKQAAEALRQAAREAKDAAEHHNPNNPPKNAVPGEVGQKVARASQHLQAAGQQLSQLGMPQPGQPESESPDGEPMSPGDGPMPQGSPEGEEQLAQGPPSGTGKPSPSQMLRQAAQSLRDAAGDAGVTPNQQPSQQAGQNQADASSTSASSDFGNEALAKLVELETSLGKTSDRNWGQLPGKLQSELMESSSRRADGDYARLIRRYFQEISKTRNPLAEEKE